MKLVALKECAFPARFRTRVPFLFIQDQMGVLSCFPIPFYIGIFEKAYIVIATIITVIADAGTMLLI